MNLLCPNCQKMLQVEDQHAGQMMRCPLCNGTFTVPALPPGPSVAPVPASNPLPPSGPPPAPAPAAPTVSLKPSSPSRIPETSDVYSASPAPDIPPNPHVTPKPPPGERPKLLDSPQLSTWSEPEPAAAATPAPPPPLTPGTDHSVSLTLNPQIVPWIAPGALALVFVLMFFTWVGHYTLSSPDAVTQTGWGTGFGGAFTALGLLHNLLFVLTLALALAVVLIPRLQIKLPAALDPIWPHRWLILGGTVLLLFVLLGLQMTLGFGLDSAAEKQTEAAKNEEAKVTPTQPVIRSAEVRFARQTVYRTAAAHLALLLELVAAIGVGITYWLEQRGNRPLPRFVLTW